MASRPAALFATTIVVSACGSSARLGADANGGPSLVIPAHFAEGHNRASRAADAGAPTAADAGHLPAPPRAVPDPPPVVTSRQWRYRFVYSKGNITVASVERKDFDRPVPTERRVGRFAVELWVGNELVDRVRFDFPLLAADPAPEGRKRPLHADPAFGPGAETTREVLVPASDRATRAVLVDRLNGHIVTLAWPPDAPESPAGTASPP
jgi:hypothetical protein